MDEQHWDQLNQQLRKLYNEGRWEEAVIVAEKALDLALSLYQGDHPNIADSFISLGILYQAQGRYEQAEPSFKEALEMRQRLFEGDHPAKVSILNNLALLLANTNRPLEALELMRYQES